MDRISELSDDLLGKILLFVPTKVAVSTSILSKRWEYLWMSLPKLDYGSRYCSESECEKLRCFLDRNLPLHRAPVIETFRLKLCNSVFKPENISLWVSIALSHFLRELEILYESEPDKPIILLSSLFTCKSLEILKLDGDILLDVPRMVSLPSLKTLKLQRVRYLNEETLQRLLSSCLILEELVVGLCDYGYENAQKLTVVVPCLQSLSLYLPYSSFIDGVVIETPNLKYFKLRFRSYDDERCLIENMPYLIEAHIYVDLHLIKSILGASLSLKGLIGTITSVKRLTICSKTMLDEGCVFNQLEHLEVCLCTSLFPDQLVRLLKASPKLKRLDISLTDGHVPQGMEDLDQPSTVPECLLSSLESFSWSMYKGEPKERDIVVYFLKHAVHLQTATIKSYQWEVPKFEMIKELALSSRASTTCQLMFD